LHINAFIEFFLNSNDSLQRRENKMKDTKKTDSKPAKSSPATKETPKKSGCGCGSKKK
jgi:hypothetical protein